MSTAIMAVEIWVFEYNGDNLDQLEYFFIALVPSVRAGVMRRGGGGGGHSPSVGI